MHVKIVEMTFTSFNRNDIIIECMYARGGIHKPFYDTISIILKVGFIGHKRLT
jgi:hypothetical protein